MKKIILIVLALSCSQHTVVYSSPLNFDLTSGIIPANLSITRAGLGTFYLATGPSVAVATTDQVLIEDRGDGGGLFVFDAYTNEAPLFDFTSGAGWIVTAGGTVTAGISIGPDGITNASQLLDTSSSLNFQLLKNGTTSSSTDSVSSVWVRDAASPPTQHGAELAGDPLGGTGGVQLPTPTRAWRRVSSAYVKAGADVPHIKIQAAGATVISQNTDATFNADATGGVEAWGAQTTTAEGDVPLLSGSTDAVLVQPSGSLSGMIQPGAADISVYVSFLSDPLFAKLPDGVNTYALNFTTPDGEGALRLSNSIDVSFDAILNGSMVQSSNVVQLLYAPWQVVGLDLFSNASKGTAGLNVWFNGCRMTISARSSPVSMHSPTTATLGSRAGTVGTYLPRRYKSLELASGRDPNRGEGVILGDSTSTSWQGDKIPIPCSFMYTAPEAASRNGIINAAIPGYTISDGLALWQTATKIQQRGAVSLSWVMVRLGINDANNGRTEAQMVSDMNALISDINTQNPSAKIVLLPNTPCLGLLGSTKWGVLKAFNADLAGTGTLTISGTNLVRAPLATWSSMDDGQGNLIQLYNVDGVHFNAAASAFVGAQQRSILKRSSLL